MFGIGDTATIDELTAAGWNVLERATLDTRIANRQPFLDFIYSRTLLDGRVQYLQVSGEPMFDAASGFAGYRGIGLDVSERMRRSCGGQAASDRQRRAPARRVVIDQLKFSPPIPQKGFEANRRIWAAQR
jgi:hypothetical protein